MELEEEKHYPEIPDALPIMKIDECFVDLLYAEGEDIPNDGEPCCVRFLLLGNNNCCHCQAPEWKEDLCEIWAVSKETV